MLGMPRPWLKFYPTWTLVVDCYNLIHVILPRLSREDCSLFALELTCTCLGFSPIQRIKGLFVVITCLACKFWLVHLSTHPHGCTGLI